MKTIQSTIEEVEKKFSDKFCSSERHRLRKLISNWEIDKESHSKGKCSFSILALCSAEEQKIKRDLLKLLE